jgi:hypothetical protein
MSGVFIMTRENSETKKETTIIGVVREIRNYRKPYRVGIAVGDEIYVVQPNEEGLNLLYEVGNKVEATGIISKTKEIRRRIEATGYEVYEISEDDPEEFDYDLKNNLRPE